MADLRASTSIGGSLAWHSGNLRFDTQGNTIRYAGFKIFTENDTPLPGELGNGESTSAYDKTEADARFSPATGGGYLPLTGGTMTGKLTNTANDINITGVSPRLTLTETDGFEWRLQVNSNAFTLIEDGVTAFSVNASVMNTTKNIAINGKTAFRGFDTWLRINDLGTHTSGIYIGASYLNGVGYLKMNTGRFYSTATLGLTSVSHAFTIGEDAAKNVAYSNEAIQSRNNGVAEILHLNFSGGDVTINSNVAYHTGNLTKPVIDALGVDAATFGNKLPDEYGAASSTSQIDPDLMKTTSGYRFDPHVNNPTNSDWWSITTSGNNVNVIGQHAINFATGDAYTRAFNTVWTPWRKQWNDNNDAPLAKLAGTQTFTGVNTFTGANLFTGTFTGDLIGNADTATTATLADNATLFDGTAKAKFIQDAGDQQILGLTTLATNSGIPSSVIGGNGYISLVIKDTVNNYPGIVFTGVGGHHGLMRINNGDGFIWSTSDGTADFTGRMTLSEAGVLKVNGSIVPTLATSNVYTDTAIQTFSQRIQIEGVAGWSYVRLQDNKGTSWDLASNQTQLSDAFQIRPNGSGTNGYVFHKSGQFITPQLKIGLAAGYWSGNSSYMQYQGGNVYFLTSVPIFYNYAINTYMGNTTGATTHFRGSTITATSWGITSAGVSTFAGLKINGTAEMDYGIHGGFGGGNGAGGSWGATIWGMGTSYDGGHAGTSYTRGNYCLMWLRSGMSTQGYNGYAGEGIYVASQNSVCGAIGHLGIWSSGNITAYSDRRIKTDIRTIEGALGKVCSVGGYTFDRTDLTDLPRQTGVIAQEILEILPEAVMGGATADDPDGHYSVAYGQMAGLFIEAIKELKDEKDQVEVELSDLRTEFSEFKAHMLEYISGTSR